MTPLRILIVDDHPLVRRGLTATLGEVDDLLVVGAASSAAEALEQTSSLQPDVVLMDLQMPGGSGIEATRAIRAQHSQARILVLTLLDDDDSVFLALRAGAHGYVLKDASEVDLLRAIRAVGSGQAIFSPAVASRVLAYFSAPRQPVDQVAFPELTERERQLLELIAQGLANAAIAARLALSPKTVANYVSSIFGKLRLPTTDQDHRRVLAVLAYLRDS